MGPGRAGAIIGLSVDDETRDRIKSLVGEGFHTAFRKAVDNEQAMPIHRLINDMPAKDWDNIIEFVVSGLEFSGVVFLTPPD